MKAKLIKREDGLYFLNDKLGNLVYGKLSLKNCQAIELGYDLDELAKDYAINQLANPNEYEHSIYASAIQNTYMVGFKKALDLMGVKKFSDEDVILIAEYIRVASQSTPNVRTKELFNEYQSLQQTEWDVKIEMECPQCQDWGYVSECRKDCGKKFLEPKLDADGCLILKLKL